MIRRSADAMIAGLAPAAKADVRAVHQVRVASRRLRAALPLAAAAANVDARGLSRDVRHVTRALGDLREADVVSALLTAAEARHGWPADAAARVQGDCQGERDTALSKMQQRVARIDAADLRARVEALTDRVDKDVRPAAATVALASAVGRRARQLAEALDEAGTVYSVESLHRVRLRTKKLRYTLEAAGDALGSTDARVMRRLKSFQELLGHIHDAQAAQRLVRGAAAARGVSRAMSTKLTRMDADLETECRRLHARVVKARPAMDQLVRQTLTQVASRLSPRGIGRMAQMRADRKARRMAVGE